MPTVRERIELDYWNRAVAHVPAGDTPAEGARAIHAEMAERWGDDWEEAIPTGPAIGATGEPRDRHG